MKCNVYISFSLCSFIDTPHCAAFDFHFVYEVSCMLKPGAHPRVGNPEVTGIPQVDSSTRQQQLTSTHAEVTYLTKPPITTKPVVRTN